MSIQSICAAAATAGKLISLQHCYYGIPHWKGPFASATENYYFFLGGLVKSQRLRFILELGTHCGGSIKAMYQGIHADDLATCEIVTVDLNQREGFEFSEFPLLKRIEGDCASPAVMEKVKKCFSGQIDLLFIDSDHSAEHVEAVMKAYGDILSPHYIVLDDIFINQSMKKFWKSISRPGFAEDITILANRQQDVGMGFIQWRAAAGN